MRKMDRNTKRKILIAISYSPVVILFVSPFFLFGWKVALIMYGIVAIPCIAMVCVFVGLDPDAFIND